MDPFTLIKTLWHHKRVALPCILIGILAMGFVLVLGPRTYESTAEFVVVNPNPPTEREIERDKRLAKLNDDNPYIRAVDPSLIVRVLISKLSAQSTQLQLKATGLDGSYTVSQSALSPMTFTIAAQGSSPEMSVAIREWLIGTMQKQIYDLQTVKGADGRYLFNALPVDLSVEATEKVSSRLRGLILAGAASVILLIGAVSVAVGMEKRKQLKEAAEGSSTAVRDPTRNVSADSGMTGDRENDGAGALGAPVVEGPQPLPRPRRAHPSNPSATVSDLHE